MDEEKVTYKENVQQYNLNTQNLTHKSSNNSDHHVFHKNGVSKPALYNGSQIGNKSPIDTGNQVGNKDSLNKGGQQGQNSPMNNGEQQGQKPPINNVGKQEQKPPINNGVQKEQKPLLNNGGQQEQKPPLNNGGQKEQKPSINNEGKKEKKPPLNNGLPKDKASPLNKGNLGTDKLNGNNTNLSNKDALKQKVASDAITKAAKAYNPALGKAVEVASKSKVGKKIMDNAMKKNPFIQKGNIVDKFLPKDNNEPTDGDGKKISEKNQENSLDKVTTIIMTPKMKIILPIVIASCVVMFGICIIIVCAHANYTVYGVDLSSQISIDDMDIQDKIMSEQDTSGIDAADNSSQNSSSSSSSSNSNSTNADSNSNNSNSNNYVSNVTSSDSDSRLKKIKIENGFKDQVFYYSQSDFGESYGGYGTIGSHGCGPTSLAIVISSLLQEAHSPIELTNYMCSNGWCSDNGASWQQIVSVEQDYASKYGLKQKNVSDLDELRKMIRGGNALAVTIMSTGRGRPNIVFNDGTGMYFSGHFFVIAGITPEGDGIVVDPSSHGGNNGKSTSLEVLAQNNHNSSAEPSFWVVYK